MSGTRLSVSRITTPRASVKVGSSSSSSPPSCSSSTTTSLQPPSLIPLPNSSETMTISSTTTKRRDDEEESDTPPPPDGGWGWVVVLGSFMIHVITDGVTYSFGIFHTVFLDYFNEGKGKTAWIASTLVGVTLCSGPISSIFVNRYGCRAVTIAGAVLATICLVISVFAENIITLCITIGIGTGFGFGLIYLPAIVSVTTYFEKRRSLATGIAVCGSGIGTFVFASVITLLLNEYGWRGSMLIIAGTVFKCTIFGAMFRPLEPERKSIIGSKNVKSCEAQIDIHISDHDLNQFGLMNGDQKIHRPRSMGHFNMQSKIETNGNVVTNHYNKMQNNDVSRLALSQPMLTQSDNTHHHRHHYGSQSLRRHAITAKPDVFYQGSLMNIPAYRSRLDLKNDEAAFIQRRHSTYSYKRRHVEEEVEEATFCGVIPCSQENKETLMAMFNLSLFKDIIFILFALSNFLTSIGFNIPYLYIVPQANTLGITSDEASVLLSIIGIANTVARIILGYISDKPWVNRLMIYNLCLTICGIATVLSAFCTGFYSLAIYCSVFGFTIGAYVGLTSVILVDLLGLDKLTNAFGLLLLFQGIASLVGPPIAGGLYDQTLSYNPGFYLAGITIGLSGVILFAIPSLQRHVERKNQSEGIADI